MERKSPSFSSTDFEIGTLKKGNDGEIWMVDSTSKGIHRWVKLSPTLAEKNLTRLTKNLNWNVRTRNFSNITINETPNLIRDITNTEFKTPVLFGINKIFIGGGFSEKEHGKFASHIRYITIGTDQKYTTLKQLLRAMFKAYQKPIKKDEFEDLLMRTESKEEKFQIIIDYEMKRMTFGDWHQPWVYFEGPLYKTKFRLDDQEKLQDIYYHILYPN